MKLIILVAIVVTVAAEEELYTTLNDDLDVDAVLADPATLKEFLDCFMEREPCTDLSESYRRHMDEAVAQACKKCKPVQKKNFRKFLTGIKDIAPKDFSEFRKKYDPEDKYFQPLEEELSKY